MRRERQAATEIPRRRKKVPQSREKSIELPRSREDHEKTTKENRRILHFFAFFVSSWQLS